MPGGMAAPIPRPSNEMKAGEWNTIDIVLDANILRPFLNDAGGISGGVADEEFGRSGAIALHAGGTGDVRFRDVSYKDLQPRVALPEEVSSRFRMQALNEFYYSWGPDVADINRDGVPDIVAGPYYYLGPDYNVAREIYMAATIDAGTRYFNGVQFTYDFTGDGWPDVINSLFTQPTVLYVNPRGEPRRWDMYTVTDRITSELALMKDVNGDGKLEYIFKDANNQFVYANPDPANPTAPWIVKSVSERHVDHARDQHTRSMGESRNGRGGRQRRRPSRFRERLRLVGGASKREYRHVGVPPWRVRQVESLEPWRIGDWRV